MTTRSFLLAPALLLASCASDPDLSSSTMTLDSEYCRSATVTQLDARVPLREQTTSERQSDFDRAYRACMATKGY